MPIFEIDESCVKCYYKILEVLSLGNMNKCIARLKILTL